MSNELDLRTRVESRRQELIKQITELKASTAADAAATRGAIVKQLSTLREVMKGGWDHLGDSAKEQLHHWLDN